MQHYQEDIVGSAFQSLLELVEACDIPDNQWTSDPGNIREVRHGSLRS